MDVDSGAIRMNVSTLFYDPVLVPNGEVISAYPRFPFDATPAQVENAFEDAAIEAGTGNWPGMDVPRNQILMFDVKKGL
jgi:hypothetical protein